MYLVRVFLFIIFFLFIPNIIGHEIYSEQSTEIKNTLRLPHLFENTGNTIQSIVGSKSLSLKDKLEIIGMFKYIREPLEEKVEFYNSIRELLNNIEIYLESGVRKFIEKRYRKNFKFLDFINVLFRDSILKLVIFNDSFYFHQRQLDSLIRKNDFFGIEKFIYDIENKGFDVEKFLNEPYYIFKFKSKPFFTKTTFLHEACEAGFYQVVEILLHKGVNVNVEDGKKRKALYYFLMNFSVFRTQYIDDNEHTKSFSKILQTDGKHKFIYKIAAQNRNIDILFYYLPNAKFEEITYISQYLTTQYFFYKAVEVLVSEKRLPKDENIRLFLLWKYFVLSRLYKDISDLEYSVNVFLKSNDEQIYDKIQSYKKIKHADTGIFQLIEKGDLQGLEKFISKLSGNKSKKEFINTKIDRFNRGLLHKALENKKINININALDMNLLKALIHYAVESKNIEYLKILLTREDLEIDLKNADGDSALHLAVLNNDFKKVKLLVNAGADINCQGGDGLTVLELAIKEKDTDSKIIEFLLLKEIRIKQIRSIIDIAKDIMKLNLKYLTLDVLHMEFKDSLIEKKIQQYKEKAWEVRYMKKRQIKYEIAQCMIFDLKGKNIIAISDTYLQMHKIIESLVPKEQCEKSLDRFFVSKGKQNDFKNLIKPLERLINLNKGKINISIKEDIFKIRQELKEIFGIYVTLDEIIVQFSNLKIKVIRKYKKGFLKEYFIDLDKEDVKSAAIKRRLINEEGEWIAGKGVHVIFRNGFKRDMPDFERVHILPLFFNAKKVGSKVSWLLNVDGIKKAKSDSFFEILFSGGLTKLFTLNIDGELITESEKIYGMRKAIKDEKVKDNFRSLNEAFQYYLRDNLDIEQSKQMEGILETFVEKEKSKINREKFFYDTHIEEKFIISIQPGKDQQDRRIHDVKNIEHDILIYKNSNLALLKKLIKYIFGPKSLMLNLDDALLAKRILKADFKEKTINNFFKIRLQYLLLRSV